METIRYRKFQKKENGNTRPEPGNNANKGLATTPAPSYLFSTDPR